MTPKNILFHQRQLERLWRAVRTKLSEGHPLPAHLLKGTPPAEWLAIRSAEKNPPDEILDNLANWLGYGGFKDFSLDNKQQLPNVITSKQARFLLWTALLLGALSVAGLAYVLLAKPGSEPAVAYQVKTGDVSATDRDAIEELIRKANETEFASYKTLPEIDTTELGNYFAYGSPAYQVIISNLTDASNCNWTLQNPGNASYFVVVDLDVKNSENRTAEVITRENWYLEYFLPDSSSSVYTYNNLSTQYYQVKRSEGGNWKVHLNAYPPAK